MSKLKRCSTLQHPTSAVVSSTRTLHFSSAARPSLRISEIYQVATRAKTKLGDEVECSNQDLRRMVGHANLLDSLMIKLFDSEIEREDWLHQNVHTASANVATRCMKWVDRILDDFDDAQDNYDNDDADSEDSGSDDCIDLHDDSPLLFNTPLCRVKSIEARNSDDSERIEEVELIDAEKHVNANLDDVFVATLEHSLPKIVQEVETAAKGERLLNVTLIQTREVSA